MNLKAGYPFSLIKNGLVSNYPKLEENIRTDVVIMGGGISGALTAWHLAQKNIPCIVMDARSIGLGSTCASTSLLQYEIDIPLHKLSSLIGIKNAVASYWLCKEAIDKLILAAGKIGFADIQKNKVFIMLPPKKMLTILKKSLK